MSTWREHSWDALARGEAVDPRWPDYAAYARLRSSGLRAEALEAADRCAASLAAGVDDLRWDFTAWLLTDLLTPGTTRSMVLPHALEAIVTASLWQAHDRGEAVATAGLVEWFPVEVMAREDFRTDAIGHLLREAVSAHPGEVRLRTMLAEHLVAWVRADTADVANGRYDGDPAADLDRLAEAASLLDDDAPLRSTIDEYRAIVADWTDRPR